MSKLKKGDTVWHPWIRTTGPKTFAIYARTGIVTDTGSGTYRRDGDRCGVAYGDKSWVEYKSSTGVSYDDREDACFHTKKEALEHLKAEVDADEERNKSFRDSRIEDSEKSIERTRKSIEGYKESFALEQRIAAEKHVQLDELLKEIEA